MSARVAVLEDISRVYDGAVPTIALARATIELFEGDLVTIVGPSGAGKSTLLNMLGLLDRPTTGRVWIGGVDTSLMEERQLARLRARTLGFVFQAFHLVPHKTVIENVEMGMLYADLPRRARRERAGSAIDRLRMTHRASAFPGTLSGGERQRVALARALANDPQLLLCDEPTGNLDSVTSAEVVELLQDLNAGGQTTVIVTHDATVAGVGRRSLTVEDGLVTEAALVPCD
jgi:putative ABC transport system ATP-binding protein